MPNFDTGHYFLTTLAPIKKGTMVNNDKEVLSFAQNLQRVLDTLPTALQSPATEKVGINSPFVREKSTHFCRFTIINNVVFNGRNKSNVLWRVLEKINPLIPNHVDSLKSEYLMFVVDFDAVMSIGDSLPDTLSLHEQNEVRNAYAKRLWQHLQTEIQKIYSNCVGFEKVETAENFAQYIEKCQIETTMSFNDYWINPPTLHRLSIPMLAALVGTPIVVALVSLLCFIFGRSHIPILGWSSGWSLALGSLSIAIALYVAYLYILWNGRKPMSPGKYADLPSVLKSLYIQQNFKQFAIDAQSMSKDDLYNNFGEFLKQHKLHQKNSPTQNAGVIDLKG